MNIAIIPARGGSKRIPNKNIKEFLGKPIIAYSIETAIKSQLFDKVIVSTDSEEIARIAIKYGAEVPFFRPKKLSTDKAITADVLTHTLEFMKNNNYNVDYLCCIYPTAPFVRKKELIEAFSLLKEHDCCEVFPVTTFDYCIFRALKLEGEKVSMVWEENELKCSQDFPEAFHDAGQFYFFNAKKFIENQKIIDSDSKCINIPRY